MFDHVTIESDVSQDAAGEIGVMEVGLLMRMEEARRPVSSGEVPLGAKLVALAIAASLVFAVPDVIMLLFAAALLAVLVRGLTNLVARLAPVGDKVAFTIVVVSLVALAGTVLWFVASSFADELGRLREQLPRAWHDFQAWLATTRWETIARRYVPATGEAWDQLVGAQRAVGAISSTFGVLADLFVLVFVGLYLAADPQTYVDGAVRLLPPSRRARTCEVLHTTGATLRRWLVGRFVLMMSNGAITWLVLWAIGVPLPFVLGLLSGLLNFVPNIGPLLAAIPAVLIAFTAGPQTALHVAAFYFVYQMIDGYVLTPIVQSRTVALPPALTITSQVVLGVLLGGMGVVLAVPAVAVAMVMVKMFYISDVLGERVSLPDHVEPAQ